jgi:hypothetical protein
LVDACRIMSGKTIKLLQIVYGAELKRLFTVADDLLSSLGGLDASVAETDPQAFADKASELASKAAQLAAYVSARAKDEESPILKAELTRQAKALDDKASDLINAVNALLEDPTDPNKRKAVQSAIKDLEELIAATASTARETQADMPGAEESLPTLHKAITKKAAEDLELVMHEAARAAAAPAPVAAATSAITFAPVAEPVRESPVDSLLEKLRRAADDLATAAAEKDASAAAAAGQDLLDALAELKQGCEQLTAINKDAGRKQELQNSIAQLERLIAAEMAAAKKAVETGDAKAVAEAKARAADLKRLLDNIHNQTVPTVADKMQQMKDIIAEIQDAAKKGDTKKVDALRALLGKLALDLEHEGKWIAQSHTDPKTAASLVRAIDALIAATRNIDIAASTNDKAKLDASAKNAHAAIEELLALSNALPLSTIKSVQNDLDVLELAVNSGDAIGLVNASAAMSKNVSALMKQAREAALKTADPEQRARIQNNLGALSKALADQLAAIKRFQLNPNDPDAKADLLSKTAAVRDALRALEDSLAGRAGATEGVADAAAVAAALNGITSTMSKLDQLAAKLKANPKDKAAQDALKAALGDLDSLNAALVDGISKDPEIAIVAKAEEVKTIADDMSASLAAKDPKATVEGSKRLAAASKQLVEQLRALSVAAKSTGDLSRGAELDAAADNVNNAFAAALKAVKDALDNPDDAAKQLEAQRAIAVLKNAAERAAQLTGSSPHDEKDMRDLAKQLEEDFQRAKDAAARGDHTAVEQALQKLEKDRAKFVRAAVRREPHLLDAQKRKAAHDALEEFKSLADKLGHAARELARNPKDAKASQHLDQVSSGAVKKAQDVMNAHNSDAVAAVQDLEASLDKLMDALDRGDAQAAANEAKQAVAKTNALVPLVQNETDPAKREKLLAALKDLNENHIRTILTDASEAIKDPANITKREKVREDIAKAKVATSKMIGALSPDNDRQGAAAVAQAQADVASLQAAIRSGDAAKIKAAKESLQKDLQAAIDTLRAAIEAETDPIKKKALETKLKRLEKLQQDLNNPNLTTEQLGRLNMQISDALQGLVAGIGADKLDELARNAGCVAPNAAKLRDSIGDGMDINGFMNLAQQLGVELSSLLGFANDLARSQKGSGKLSEDASAALALDDLLRQMESQTAPAAGSATLADLNSLLDQLNKLDKASAAPAGPPAGQEKTFDAVLERAAETIQTAVRESQMDNAVSEGIVSELRKLAAAARGGQRQAMLLSSRAIAANVQSLVTEISSVLGKMGAKNPKEQDRLIRNSQALRNFATQLKILTSVKAASIDKDNDSDESLFSVTRGLGKVVAESIGSLDTVKITVLKENPNKK